MTTVPSTSTNTTDVLLTSSQLAARWQVSAHTLANHRSLDRGAPFVRVGTRVRYRLSDVLAYEVSTRPDAA